VSINDDISHHVHILIHIISVERLPTMKVNIHNQCSNFKLELLGYFTNGIADWNVDLVEEVDTGSMTSVDLMPFLAMFGGVIVYEQQRKHVKPGNQTKSTVILLSVAWRSEGYKKFRVFVHLMECNTWSYGV
jgi:hypothetical protein